MRKSRGFGSTFGLAFIQQVPFGELFAVLVFVLENSRQFPAFPLKFLYLFELLFALGEGGHFGRRVHHAGYHGVVFYFDALHFFFGAVITVEVFLPVLQILYFRVVLFTCISF